MSWPHPGSLKVRVVVYCLILAGVMVLLFLRVGYEQARARDLRRVADALIIRQAFERMYLHDRSYSAAADHGCDKTGVSVRQCNLRAYYREINELVDPGKHDYVISQVPSETNYEVSFWLELDHRDIAKGLHKITTEGIQ